MITAISCISRSSRVRTILLCGKSNATISCCRRSGQTIKIKGVKPINMNHDDWDALNKLAHSISFDALFNIEGLDFAMFTIEGLILKV